jgi:hypothetical protein
MNHSPLWLPDVLRGAGLKVQDVVGWQTHGHAGVRDISGVMCHRTCRPRVRKASSF